ncbi:MAG: Maf family protein [Candidatus Sumerlaeia bacterium]
MDDKAMKIILASASPRRRELLEWLGLPFEVRTPVDEEDEGQGTLPGVLAMRLALKKAQGVAQALGDEPALVIGADTVVALGRRILGKPRDREEACMMLRALRARVHDVITGVAVVQTRPCAVYVDKALTRVRFRDFSDAELEAYAATSEPYDKAGAYGIQGLGGRLVEEVDGDYFNVVGLPLTVLLNLLGFFMDVRPYAARISQPNRGRSLFTRAPASQP